MAQPREAANDFGQHQPRTVTVLDVGDLDHGVNQIALGIGEDVALAALDILACVKAARIPAFRDFHAPAVDYPSTGRCLAANHLAPDLQQGMIERQP
jgi:hypothetical protein